MKNKHLSILGTRGIPACHGGFETFAEHLATYLSKQGWEVTVYCQEQGMGRNYQDDWQGVRLIHIPVKQKGPLASIVFDFKAIIHSLRSPGVFLTLGYNTAIFNLIYRLGNRPNIINMDGIEWKRQKWGKLAKAWFWINERFACWFADHLIADNPHIATHLESRTSASRISMIPYGGELGTAYKPESLIDFNVIENQYAIVVARGEPENSILEIVSAFSSRQRGIKLLVIGNYTPDSNPYHQSVMNAASDEVLFPGAIYKPQLILTLRHYARFYLHGHQAGGTNPSLVEALGVGNAVLAFDNAFNRWVAGNSALYFHDNLSLELAIERLTEDDETLFLLQNNAQQQFQNTFQWPDILEQYEKLLTQYQHQRYNSK